jgi:hypothetical protein
MCSYDNLTVWDKFVTEIQSIFRVCDFLTVKQKPKLAKRIVSWQRTQIHVRQNITLGI